MNSRLVHTLAPQMLLPSWGHTSVRLSYVPCILSGHNMVLIPYYSLNYSSRTSNFVVNIHARPGASTVHFHSQIFHGHVSLFEIPTDAPKRSTRWENSPSRTHLFSFRNLLPTHAYGVWATYWVRFGKFALRFYEVVLSQFMHARLCTQSLRLFCPSCSCGQMSTGVSLLFYSSHTLIRNISVRSYDGIYAEGRCPQLLSIYFPKRNCFPEGPRRTLLEFTQPSGWGTYCINPNLYLTDGSLQWILSKYWKYPSQRVIHKCILP